MHKVLDVKKDIQVPKYTDNHKWFCNPQFYLNLEEETHFKIVLSLGTKKKNRINKNVKLGFNLCKTPETKNEIVNESIPKREQIEIRKNKMQ